MGPEWHYLTVQVCGRYISLCYVRAHALVFPQLDTLMDSNRVEPQTMFSVVEQPRVVI